MLIRRLCRQDRIPGAVWQDGVWRIPEDAVRISRTNLEHTDEMELPELAKKLQNQKKKRNYHGLYDYAVIDLTYSSSRMASVRLTRLQVETIFKKGKVQVAFEPMKVSDVIEVLNHIHCVDYTQEGEQRFDSHTDKLTNYIRFWQADGESEKTSIRTRTALGQLVEDGYFKGGLAPYGYDLIKSGRFNKRKHELYELVVNEAEAAVVRIIFDKYVHEGFGAQRIATYLNKLGYRARSGKNWHHASIRGIICNLTYTGVLRSGDSRSQVLPHLQIIPPELFEAAQSIRTTRANSAEQERRIPLNTRGSSLLAGNVFCGHCGSRLSLTTNGKAYPCKDDPSRIVKRVRYICYGKTRKQTECDGQTGYTAHTLDGIIDKVVRQIFDRMKAIPKSEVVNIRYKEKMEERKSLLQSVRGEYAKAAADLEALKGEVLKSIRGESTFSKELLGSLIAEAEAKCADLQKSMEGAQAAYDEGKAVLAILNAQYDDIISWSEMYDTASMEAKKMIVSCLIKRVDVYRDYKLHIDFNIDFNQFSGGLDMITIAA